LAARLVPDIACFGHQQKQAAHCVQWCCHTGLPEKAIFCTGQTWIQMPQPLQEDPSKNFLSSLGMMALAKGFAHEVKILSLIDNFKGFTVCL